MSFTHSPVLLEQVLALLDPKPGFVAVDATVGGAGHAIEIARRLGPTGHLIGFDQDQAALGAAGLRLKEVPCNVTLVYANFRHLQSELERLEIAAVDIVFFDLGVSSPQLDDVERGFSYWGGDLDMRMDVNAAITAADVVNEWPEEELARVLFEYGEERYSRRIAKKIVVRRQATRITTANELVDIVKSSIPAAARRQGGHPARRTFQALRIAVNDEIEALRDGLGAAQNMMRRGGRIGVISFHSLEDRLVKHTFRDDPSLVPVTKRPVMADEEECARNARSRSAKLRVAEVLVPRGRE